MNTQTANQTDDQALINDLFSEFDLDLDAAETAVQPEQEVVLAAEPTAEELVLDDVELDLDLSDIDLELAAEPVAEVITVEEAAPAEPVQEVAPPSADDVEFDLELDQAETAEVKALEDAVETETEVKKVKPKASSGGNRVTYYNSSKSTVLLDRLGGNKELIILEASDLELSKEELQAKRQYLLDVMNHQPMTMNDKGDPMKSDGLNGQTVQKKVAEKVIQLFTYMGKGGNLNKVMRLAFQTLITEGYLSFGKQGNLEAVLLANEYNIGTARAQSGQIKQLFPLLKIVTVEGNMMKQNPESIILAKLNADLFPEQAA